MIRNEIFICEKCGLVYNNEEACRKCEQGHIIPVSIGECVYTGLRDMMMTGTLYKGTKKHPLEETTKTLVPTTIQIKFSDGLYRTYHLYGTGEGFKAPISKGQKKRYPKGETNVMDSAQDFEYIRMGLNNALVRELRQLKKTMSEMDENKIESDIEYAAVFTGRIFLCSEGLKKIAAVMGFMDAWEENGDIPQLNPNCDFSNICWDEKTD